MDTVHECDRQTDGQTDRITIPKTVQRRASHGKNVTLTELKYVCLFVGKPTQYVAYPTHTRPTPQQNTYPPREGMLLLLIIIII